MGFRVDGCGTYDGNKKIKLVGEFKCPNCGKIAPFYIYEKSKKITVLYVPVAKIKKDYGVYCEKCKRGYLLTEQQKVDALNGDLRYIRSLLDDVPIAVDTSTNTSGVTSNTGSMNNTGGTNITSGADSAAKSNICPNCKTPIGEGMSFCGKCGARVVPDTCPNCSAPIGDGMSFCGKCGTRVR